MPAFHFPFQSLLNQRERAEKQCQRALAELFHKRATWMQRIQSHQHQLRDSKASMKDALQGRVDLDAVTGFARLSAATQVQGHASVRGLAALEQEIDNARAVLREATRQRKSLELIRDRRYQAWKQQQDRRETRENDEVGAMLVAMREREAVR